MLYRGVGIGLALAAGMASLAVSGPALAQTRTGFAGPYIGAAIGFGGHDVEIRNLTETTHFSDDDTAFSSGAYAGFTLSGCCGPFVLGLETDFNFLGGSPSAADGMVGPGGLTETTTLKSDVDWFGTLRARVGYAVQDNVLIYGTGGLAYGRVEHTLADDCVGCGTTLFNLGTFKQSDQSTRVGWTAGGGAEYRLDSNWSLRGEALFVDLGTTTQEYVVTTTLGTATALTKWEDEFWVARFGASYRFGP